MCLVQVDGKCPARDLQLSTTMPWSMPKQKSAPKRIVTKRTRSTAVREISSAYGLTTHTKPDNLRFIDLFCGIGGFRIAVERAGAHCVFSCDWDKFSRQTYAANFGETPQADINQIATADIPGFDILCAGFPCQPFSIAGVSKKLSLGRKHGFEDEKQGNLFFNIAQILKYHRPAAFVLENVKNLRTHDKGRTFEIIHNTLTRSLGYHTYYKIIDARSVVPQHRERIFIVGFREPRDFEFPVFPKQGPVLASILDPQVPDKYTLTDHLWKCPHKPAPPVAPRVCPAYGLPAQLYHPGLRYPSLPSVWKFSCCSRNFKNCGAHSRELASSGGLPASPGAAA